MKPLAPAPHPSTRPRAGSGPAGLATAPWIVPLDPAADLGLLRRQLRWLVAIRLVVVTSITLLYFLLSLLPSQPLDRLDPRPLLALTGATYAASLFYIALLQLAPGRVALQAYVQFAGDLVLVTCLVYLFGGASSPFSLLYLVVISVSAALLRRRSAFFVATLAYFAYSATVVALHQEWVPLPTGGYEFEPVSLTRLAYALAAHLAGFYGVAALTAFLARDVARVERELEARSEAMADLQVVYHDVIQSISSGLLTTDLEGRVTSINRAGEQLLHTTANQVLGRSLVGEGFFAAPEWEDLTLQSRSNERARNEIEIEPSWSPAPLVLGFSITRLTDAHGSHNGYILVFQDLSEWRRLQEELRIKDRMAAVGELAAGLAHEVGNPLAAISGSVQMLAPQHEPGSPQERLLQILLKESQRLDRTIKSFLLFARPRERADVRFDVAQLLAEHAELLRNSPERRPDHRLELDLRPRHAEVTADPDQISQIFWNLVRNALRAMPAGGTLTIVGHLRPDGVYLLRVRDDGRGMSEEERTRMFQPFKSFFDQGTGIGMAIVYRLVQEHGGRLVVDSAPGRGTEVTAELPIGHAAATLREAATP